MLSFAAHPVQTSMMMMDAMMSDALLDRLAVLPRARNRDALPSRLVPKEDGTYALTLSAPGVKPEDLKVSVSDEKVLRVSGETTTPVGVHSICWAARLPNDVDTNAISATLNHGILSLTLAKKTEARPMQIELSKVTTDASESDDDDDTSYTLTLPVPGLAADDLTLNVANEVLHIKGETKRTGAHVAKSMRLPHDVDVAGARASHVDGLLTITLPRREAELKTIVVRTGEHDIDQRPATDKMKDTEMSPAASA